MHFLSRSCHRCFKEKRFYMNVSQNQMKHRETVWSRDLYHSSGSKEEAASHIIHIIMVYLLMLVIHTVNNLYNQLCCHASGNQVYLSVFMKTCDTNAFVKIQACCLYTPDVPLWGPAESKYSRSINRQQSFSQLLYTAKQSGAIKAQLVLYHKLQNRTSYLIVRKRHPDFQGRLQSNDKNLVQKGKTIISTWLQGQQRAAACAYLSERGHGQQRVVCDGVVSEVWRRTQRFNTAHLPLRTTEQTSRITRPHSHHPPGDQWENSTAGQGEETRTN